MMRISRRSVVAAIAAAFFTCGVQAQTEAYEKLLTEQAKRDDTTRPASVNYVPNPDAAFKTWYVREGYKSRQLNEYGNLSYDAARDWLLFESRNTVEKDSSAHYIGEVESRLHQYDCATGDMRDVKLAKVTAKGETTVETAPADVVSSLARKWFLPLLWEDPVKRATQDAWLLDSVARLDEICQRMRPAIRSPAPWASAALGGLSSQQKVLTAALAKLQGPEAAAGLQDLQRLDAQGDARATYELALAGLQRQARSSDVADLLERAAERGSVAAQVLYRFKFVNGSILTAQDAPAFIEQRKQRAAGAKPGWAPITLGLAHEYRVPGMKTDSMEARRWYLQAAQAGERAAMDYLAYLYVTAYDIPPGRRAQWDEWKATGDAWSRKALALGEPQILYDKAFWERGFNPVDVKDEPSLRRAADSGHPLALDLVVREVCNGKSSFGRSSPKAACDAYLSAAEAMGRPQARLSLEIRKALNDGRDVSALCARQEQAGRVELGLYGFMAASPILRESLSACFWEAGYLPKRDMAPFLHDGGRNLPDGSFKGGTYVQREALGYSNFDFIAGMEKVAPVTVQLQRMKAYAEMRKLLSPATKYYELLDTGNRRDCYKLVQRLQTENAFADNARFWALAAELTPCLQNYAKQMRTDAAPPAFASYKLMTPREKALATQTHELIVKDQYQYVKYVLGEVDHMARSIRGAKEEDERSRAARLREMERENPAREPEGPSFATLLANTMLEMKRQTEVYVKPQISEADRAEFYARIAAQEEDPDSKLNWNKRAQEKQRADARQTGAAASLPVPDASKSNRSPVKSAGNLTSAPQRANLTEDRTRADAGSKPGSNQSSTTSESEASNSTAKASSSAQYAYERETTWRTPFPVDSEEKAIRMAEKQRADMEGNLHAGSYRSREVIFVGKPDCRVSNPNAKIPTYLCGITVRYKFESNSAPISGGTTSDQGEFENLQMVNLG